ncbi:MAG: hypothetical protein KIT17_23560 [Rubrivivax sp.]|nr:hypothetical protein [Rubrivivax sp.]
MSPDLPGARSLSRADVMRSHCLCGYAIVSDEGMIADASGRMPPELQNEADWTYFQSQLDLAQLTLLGRESHLAAPNKRDRARLVASSSVAALEKRPDAWWWNPASVSLSRVLEQLLPLGGRIAVPGGMRVFDLVLEQGAFAEFHLARAIGVKIPGGRPAFSAQARGATPESILGRAGLTPGPTITLDEAAPVELVVWRRGD